jgi:site-specific DNA-cytosine methylase
MYKTIPNTLHPSGKRICSIREYLTLMGMPSDFTFYGNVLDKIGQNVPAKTAKFIVEQAVKHLANWNETRETETNVIYQDNTKQKVYML